MREALCLSDYQELKVLEIHGIMKMLIKEWTVLIEISVPLERKQKHFLHLCNLDNLEKHGWEAGNSLIIIL